MGEMVQINNSILTSIQWLIKITNTCTHKHKENKNQLNTGIEMRTKFNCGVRDE